MDNAWIIAFYKETDPIKRLGTVYNDKEDQAMELAKLSVEIVCGKDTNRKHLKEGRYYVSEYCRVDSSNVDHFLK